MPTSEVHIGRTRMTECTRGFRAWGLGIEGTPRAQEGTQRAQHPLNHADFFSLNQSIKAPVI